MVVLSALHAGVLRARAVLYRRAKCAPDQRGVLGAEGCAFRDALAEDAEGDLNQCDAQTKGVIAFLLDAHYHLMENRRYWSDDGDKKASKILCVLASDMRHGYDRGGNWWESL